MHPAVANAVFTVRKVIHLMEVHKQASLFFACCRLGPYKTMPHSIFCSLVSVHYHHNTVIITILLSSPYYHRSILSSPYYLSYTKFPSCVRRQAFGHHTGGRYFPCYMELPTLLHRQGVRRLSHTSARPHIHTMPCMEQ